MPHSVFKERAHPFNSGVATCPCGQTFDYASERDLNMKFRMHRNVCSKPVSPKQIIMPKKAMMLREQQPDEAKRTKRVLEH